MNDYLFSVHWLLFQNIYLITSKFLHTTASMMASTSTNTAGEIYWSLKKEFGDTRHFHAKTAEKNLFKYDILTNTKQAIACEVYDKVFIDLVKVNEDGTVTPRNRAILSFDVLFALRSLLPVIQQEL